jgi:hypothetical protein
MVILNPAQFPEDNYLANFPPKRPKMAPAPNLLTSRQLEITLDWLSVGLATRREKTTAMKRHRIVNKRQPKNTNLKSVGSGTFAGALPAKLHPFF